YYYTGDGTTYTKIRYTLGRPWDAQVRISSLFSYAYNSPGRADGYLPRGGGAVYGSNSAPVAFTATGGDSNISINMVPKGTGTLNQNGVPVATTTGAQTLTNKTLTSPSISGPIISDGYIRDANANVMMAFNAVASAVNYLQISNRATGGAPVTLRAIGSDTNANLSLASQGSGTVQLNGVDAVDVSSAQTLTNKTLTSVTLGGPQSTIDLGAGSTHTFTVASTNPNASIQFQPKGGGVIALVSATGSSISYLQAAGTPTDVSLVLMPKGAGSVGLRSPNGTPIIEPIGTETDLNMNIKSKGAGAVQANGIEVTTLSGTQTLTNKTISGASNTITNLPASATPKAARLVCTTAPVVAGQGNYWAKLMSFATTGGFVYGNVTLQVSMAGQAASASVTLHIGMTNQDAIAPTIRVVSAVGTTVYIRPEYFKLVRS
ncbi:MAG: hypothetical protein KDA17_05535, partial [Candidatus Saccharibacteria bacterium]|nr:hypothetical protein [Candidatus Saccharibacteria bacterium]